MTGSLFKEIPFRRIADTLTAFWRWWKAELVAILPPGLSVLLASNKSALVITRSRNGIHAVFREAGHDTHAKWKLKTLVSDIGRFFTQVPGAKTPGRIEVRLDPALVFCGALDVPRAAERELAEVVTLQIERQFPLDAAAVVWTLTGTAEESHHSLRAGFAVARRRELDQLFAALAAAGMVTRRLVVKAAEGPAAFPVELPRALRRHLLTLASLRAPLAASFLVWLTVFVGYLAYLSYTEDRLAAVVVDGGPQLAEDRRVLADHEAGLAHGRTLALLLATPPAGAVLEELAIRLPVEAWVEAMTLKPDGLLLEGRHNEPVTLVATLEGSPFFANVRLLSASDQQDGPARFLIALDFEDLKKAP